MPSDEIFSRQQWKSAAQSTVKLDTTATIDSQFVKAPERYVKELLLQIDKLSE